MRGWFGRLRAAAVAALTMAFVACGGGGGGDAPPPAAVAPAITGQPQAVAVTEGQPASFAVTASGTAPLAYQWRRNGATIAGATGASYTLAAATLGDSGAQFSVVVSNSAGNVTSANAALTVNPAIMAPAITTQPQSVTVTAGQTATFTVVATGTAPLAYQWRRNGADIAGATGASYTTPATTVADSGAVFSVRITNASPTAVVSANATLTVNAAPPAPVAPAITTQPQDVSVTAGQTATFSVVATGTAPLVYQWRRNGADIAGATSASYATPATSLADNGAQFSVLVSNSAGSVTSGVATLAVTAPVAGPPRIRLATSNGYTLAIRADGSVIGWGNNAAGQLGVATAIAGSPARLIGVEAVSVSGGTNEAIALGGDGLVRGWGTRTAGTLVGGDVPSPVPTIVAPRPSAFGAGVVAIAVTNQLRSLALRNDGTVWFLPGEAVATGPGSLRVDPRQVPGLTEVHSILPGAGGAGKGVAVKTDGTVWEISIGGGPLAWTASATQVSGLSEIRSASCGLLHCLALSADGTVWAWGSNLGGMLGNNSTTDSTLPVRALGLNDVVAIAAGTASSHAITRDGRVWNWGSAAVSGSGMPAGSLLVPTVMPDFSDAVEITAGNAVLIRRANGTVWGWGSNSFGELGDGTSGNNRSTPVQVLGINLN
jgi:hypothetical protein